MKKEIEAILCDLDGVLTQTARLHARAWKLLFDELLTKEAAKNQAMYREFVIATDYPKYIDGKPRLEGIRSYLEAKNIKIPEGSSTESIDTMTVHSLSKKKNTLFHELLTKEGVEVYPASIDAVRAWKEKGIKTAVVSSSKNCQPILDAAGVTHLFDVVVDGIVAEEKKLLGKPQPDTFLQAARMLKVEPSRAAVAEDAAAGIEAAVKAGFGLVIGILKENNSELLKQSKTDIIINNLGELAYTGNSLRYPQDFAALEHACLCEHHIGGEIRSKKPVFFFDYDGTLTPIVPHPEDALLSPATREKLSQLAKLAPVIIISGRDRDDVKQLVGIENIYYTGSHGFDIEGPQQVAFGLPEGNSIIETVEEVARALQKKLSSLEGILVEPKKYAVAVHYRNARKNVGSKVIALTQELVDQYPGLRTGAGKMVIEVRPTIDWDKGKAMQWIADKLCLQELGFHHFYMGDDITDEDAFKLLPEHGTGIIVGDHQSPTYADYRIDSASEMDELLDSFIRIIKKQHKEDE
uniref:Trehalose 6-phosphate phosphatase n=1 Tax=Roseihalotalea indica TaxID=2867963 RepID=A0AA49JHP8_9BACT|nr:trehalose-phosphatase [Tunicatimonas sp. TK19036]